MSEFPSNMKLNINDRVEVREWRSDGTGDNSQHWKGPWLPGVVRAFDKYGNPWIVLAPTCGTCAGGYWISSALPPCPLLTTPGS
jgi:hypothetical protein